MRCLSLACKLKIILFSKKYFSSNQTEPRVYYEIVLLHSIGLYTLAFLRRIPCLYRKKMSSLIMLIFVSMRNKGLPKVVRWFFDLDSFNGNDSEMDSESYHYK